MKYTLLEMVQKILSSMDSDKVNSIGDTVESDQVVDVIESVYNDIISRSDLPEHYTIFELDASGDVTKPTLMYKPDGILEIVWIKYNNKLSSETDSNFQPVYFKEFDKFVEDMLALKESESNITAFTHNIGTASIDFKCYNDRMPQYYTTFDDYTLVFDAYNVSEETTLVGNKTMVYGQKAPTFTRTDSWVADLDDKQYTILFNEAKALAFAELKQIQNASAERSARRGWIHKQKSRRAIPTPYPGLKRMPDFGRK